MKKTTRHAAVLVTVPNRKLGRKLAQAALNARLCACANLIPGLESHYWWQGKLERSQELLILFKTTRARLPKLEQLVLELHPYDTAAFVVLSITEGSERYLAWLDDSVAPTS